MGKTIYLFCKIWVYSFQAKKELFISYDKVARKRKSLKEFAKKLN